MKYVLASVGGLITLAAIALLISGASVGELINQSATFSYIATSTSRRAADQPVSLLFVGDIMLGRHVETLMRENGDDYPFERIAPLLSGHDIDAVIGNLEGPIPANHIQTPNKSFSFSFATSTAELLARNNIQVVSLANNHTLDQSQSNFDHTVAVLNAAGVHTFGHPVSARESYVLQQTIGNRNFTFVGFNISYPSFRTASGTERVARVAENKKPGEIIVVNVHGGTEYDLTSNKIQQTFYRGLVDSGADVIIAHHPHVVQEIELYKNKIIFYSLGNFIFDQYFSKDVQEGLAVKAVVTNEGIGYELIPIVSVRSQPMIMAEAERAHWLKALAGRSATELRESIISGRISP